MNPMPELAPMLKQLRLSGILDSLESRNKLAIDKQMAYPEFLNPNINSALIQELVTGRFIDEKVAVLIAGPCGTGKSHIAQAIGHAAVRPGRDVLFTSAYTLDVTDAKAVESSLENTFERCHRLDYMFNYAGIVKNGKFDDFALTDWRHCNGDISHGCSAWR